MSYYAMTDAVREEWSRHADCLAGFGTHAGFKQDILPREDAELHAEEHGIWDLRFTNDHFCWAPDVSKRLVYVSANALVGLSLYQIPLFDLLKKGHLAVYTEMVERCGPIEGAVWQDVYDAEMVDENYQHFLRPMHFARTIRTYISRRSVSAYPCWTWFNVNLDRPSETVDDNDED